MSSRQGLRSELSQRCEWLLGKYVTQLGCSQLPTKRSVLSYFLYYHYEHQEPVKESLKRTSEEVLNIWNNHNVIKEYHVKEKVNQLFTIWKSLKKNRQRLSETQKQNEKKFSKSLDALFDISLKCSLSYDQAHNSPPSTSTAVSLKDDKLNKSLSQKSNLSLSSTSSHELCASPPRKKPKYKISPMLSSMLDRTKTSNQNGLLLMSAFSATLDRNVSDVTVSKETIRRTRQKHRAQEALLIKSSFRPKIPLTVHWDTKIFKAYKSTESEDRLAVVVSGQGVSKVLGVLIIKQSTGLSQSNGVYKLINEWNLENNITSMGFDTTASNTGNKTGACTLLEKKLGKKLLYLACRHHILELILTATFGSLLEPVVSGPNIKLFERFRKEWKNLDPMNFVGGEVDNESDTVLFIINQLKTKQPRDDYKEFLNLSLLYLGKTNDHNDQTIRINIPGAYHRARWMAKIIYCLKIYYFQNQFKLTATELSGLRKFNDFVTKIYLKAWFLSSYSISAPRNDLQLLKALVNYKNEDKSTAVAALKVFSRHLWYLNEHLVGLSFFDDQISVTSKIKMVLALTKKSSMKPMKNRVTIDPNNIVHKDIDDFVTENTRFFFKSLKIDESFLTLHPRSWKSDKTYLEGLKIVQALEVVNDSAERGIALMQSYHDTVTDETQKQYLLQVIEANRKMFSNTTKANLMTHFHKNPE